MRKHLRVIRLIQSAVLLALCLTVSFSPRAGAQTPPIAVRIIMFWMAGCPHCADVIQNVLPPLRETYGAQLDILMIEVADTQDVERLYRLADSYHIPKEHTGVPFVIVGQRVLVGSDQVRNQLPGLIDQALARGGTDWPANPVLADLLPMALSGSPATPGPASSEATAIPANAILPQTHNDGFGLAVVVMIGMVIALLHSIAVFIAGRSSPLPEWTDWLIPLLIVLGIGVAGYLAYVETQSADAICGPVGDCNAVQQSRYARLFGILPVGVFGLLGYFGLLTTWLVRRCLPRFEKPANIGFYGMAFFAVIFSLYLTYLEPFVIRAVCIWCITSSVIVTLLFLLGTRPAVRSLAISHEDT